MAAEVEAMAMEDARGRRVLDREIGQQAVRMDRSGGGHGVISVRSGARVSAALEREPGKRRAAPCGHCEGGTLSDRHRMERG